MYSDNNRVALVILFNHRYDGNFEKLERIYQSRFSDILFIVPFYDGNKENVIPVYENSRRFQGYITQAYHILKNVKATTMVFIGDDLILNPEINQFNILSNLNLNENDSFITGIIDLSKKWYWSQKTWAVNFFRNADGSEAIKYLPDSELVLNKLSEYRISEPILEGRSVYKKVTIWDIFVSLKEMGNEYFTQKLFNKSKLRIIYDFVLYHINKNRKYVLHYPLVGGYSDIFIIPSKNLYQFSHISGLFASVNLHVEIALPTSLLIVSERVKTIEESKYLNGALWGKAKRVAIENKFEFSINSLLHDFPKEHLFIHPVKLSKWN